MQDDDSVLKIYYIPENIIRKQRIGGIAIRNLLEAVIENVVLAWFILQIPFIIKVKLIIITVLGGFLVCVNIVGIKNQSILQAIGCFIWYRRRKRILHLLPVNHPGRKNMKILPETKMSFAEKLILKAKEKYKEMKK